MVLKIRFTIVILLAIVVISANNLEFNDPASCVIGAFNGLILAMWLLEVAMQSLDEDENSKSTVDPKLQRVNFLGITATLLMGSILDLGTWASVLFLTTLCCISLFLIRILKGIDDDDDFF